MNKYQIAICKTYGGGDYAWILDAPNDWRKIIDSGQCGDTLFNFLMIELADQTGGDGMDGEPMDALTAAQRLDTARRDIEAAFQAIEAMS